MKKAITIFLLAYYFLGTLCFTLSDFSMLKELPGMYQHCKATEDKDMTALDFITDHLLNIDGLFDKHDNGDEQKPHTANQCHHFVQMTNVYVTYFSLSITACQGKELEQVAPPGKFTPSDYFSAIFHPPII